MKISSRLTAKFTIQNLILKTRTLKLDKSLRWSKTTLCDCISNKDLKKYTKKGGSRQKVLIMMKAAEITMAVAVPKKGVVVFVVMMVGYEEAKK